MKKQNRDKNSAIVLLRQRENGWSILYAIKAMKRRFMVYTALILGGFILFKTNPSYLNCWFCLYLGIIAGAFCRDIGWLILVKKGWHFTNRIIDWNKVKEIAENKD